MTRILSFLALPLVIVALLLAPLFGMHFCKDEALPLLAGATALPIIGPYVKSKLWPRSKPHCCDAAHHDTSSQAKR